MLPCDEIWKSRYRKEGRSCHERRHDPREEVEQPTGTETTRGAPMLAGLTGDGTEIMAATVVTNAGRRVILPINVPTNHSSTADWKESNYCSRLTITKLRMDLIRRDL